MKNKLVKIGAVGGGLTALCCFTPILVWLFAAIGLSALVGYLDYILLPLLGIFIVILVVGVAASGNKEKA